MDRHRLRVKVKNARAMGEAVQLEGVRRAVIHGLFGGLPPEKFAHVHSMPIDQYVWVEVDAIRRHAALTIQRARRDQEQRDRAEAEARDVLDAAAEAVARVIDEPVYCATGHVEKQGGSPADPSAHAFLHAAFNDCLSPDALAPTFSAHITLALRVGHPDAPRTQLVVHVTEEGGGLGADVCVFDFPSMRPPAFVPLEAVARDKLLRRIVRELAKTAGAPDGTLASEVTVRVRTPGEMQ